MQRILVKFPELVDEILTLMIKDYFYGNYFLKSESDRLYNYFKRVCRYKLMKHYFYSKYAYSAGSLAERLVIMILN